MKKKSIWLFSIIAFLVIFLIVLGILYTTHACLDSKDVRKKEQLKSLEKQISAYRLDDPNAYQILENLYEEKGNIYRNNGEYPEAYTCYSEALQFAQKNKNHEHIAELAWFMIGLAAEQKQSALVLTLSKKYQKLIVQHDVDIFNLYHWWGMACLAENQNEAAQKILSKGLKYLKHEINYDAPEALVMIYCPLSTVYARKHDFLKMEKYLTKTTELFTKNFYLHRIEPSDNIYLSNAAYHSLKNALMEIEKNNPPRSVALGGVYRKLAECYSYDDPENYRKNMLKAIKMYPPASPQIGEVYFELGEFFHKNQKDYFDKCVPALAGVKSNSAAKMLLRISLPTIDEHPEKALQLLQLAFKALPDSNKDPSVTARIFKRFADCYSAKKDWQKAAMYAQKSFEIAKKIDKIKLSFAFVLECYGHVDDLYKSQNKIKKRIKNVQDAVAFMKTRKGDLFFLNKAYVKLGEIYKLDKRYSDAEKSYREIIKIIAENPKLRKKIEYLIQEIDAYCEIGDLCLSQKAQKRAIEAFDETSKLMTKKAISELPKRYAVKIFRNIADGYYHLNKDDLAEKYYKKAVVLLLTQKDKDCKTISYLYYRIGNIAFCQKKWQKAQKYFEKSWKNIHKQEHDIDSIIILSRKLSICYRVDKQFEKGLKFALITYEKQKNKYGNNLKTGLYAAGVGSFYNQLGQKNKAIKYLKTAHQLLKQYGEDQPVLAEKVLLYIKKIKK